jgi:prolipoprotein diacylglyceryl transferase
MTLLSYLIWNGNLEIFGYGWFSLRWYGLLFASSFIVTQQIMYYIYRKEGKPEQDVDTLTIYMVVCTILGARLGHIFFYQPEILWMDPWGVLLPFEFSPEFKFTGLSGLASHGAAVGILFGLWLYVTYAITFTKVIPPKDKNSKPKTKRGFFFTKRRKPGQSYVQVLDRIVIMVTLAGAFIRLGNFFNAEIIGKPTDGPTGIVFASKISDVLKRVDNSPVDFIEVKKNEDQPDNPGGRRAIYFYIFFQPGTEEANARRFLTNDVKAVLSSSTYSEYVSEPWNSPLNYQLTEETPGAGNWVGRVSTTGLALHPSQLYESISCLILFCVLMWLWSKRKAETQPGLIFGWFMIILWSLRFAYEFLKVNQVSFEDELPLNMGQILSIPLVIAGIVILIRAYRTKPGEFDSGDGPNANKSISAKI